MIVSKTLTLTGDTALNNINIVLDSLSLESNGKKDKKYKPNKNHLSNLMETISTFANMAEHNF